MKEAIILAGGFGTRLRHVVSDVPKPMAPVAGRPFLEHILDYLQSQGLQHVVLSTGFLHETIEQHFGTAYRGLSIGYAVEEAPLGTGGGIMNAMMHCQEDDVVVLNGDTMFRVDYGVLEDFYRKSHTLLAIVLRREKDTSRYGSVLTDPADGRLLRFREKTETCGEGIINGGIYLLNRRLFEVCGYHFPANEREAVTTPFSFEKDLMERQVLNMPFYGIVSEGYFIDIGIPEDYYRAQDDFK